MHNCRGGSLTLPLSFDSYFVGSMQKTTGYHVIDMDLKTLEMTKVVDKFIHIMIVQSNNISGGSLTLPLQNAHKKLPVL